MTPVMTLGPLTVTPYGLIVFAGALIGVLMTILRKKETGPVLPLVLLGALLFGHMWWVFFCPPGYDAETGTSMLMLRIWEGGYTLYGALFGGLLGAAAGARLSGLNLLDTLDAMAPGACAALILCRIGEYFSLQGYGGIVNEENLWVLPVSFLTYEEADWGYQEWRYAVWAWEAFAALVLLVLLFVCGKKARRGKQAALFVTGLGLSQILLEQMRQDDFVRLNPFVRFTQIAALLSLIAVLVLFVYRTRPGWMRILACFMELVFASLSIVFAEFVFQKPQFTTLLYVFSSLAAAWMVVLLWMYRPKTRILSTLLMLGSTGALLGVYIGVYMAERMEDNSLLLYGFMAVALAAIGLTLWLNRPGTAAEAVPAGNEGTAPA